MFRKIAFLTVAIAAVAFTVACHDNAGGVKGPEFDVGAVGGKCFSDNTCSGTAVCNLVTKICEAGEAECDSNDDCKVGEICSAGACITEGSCNGEVGCACTASTDCKEGLECSVNSTCQAKTVEPVSFKISRVDASLSSADLDNNNEIVTVLTEIFFSAPAPAQYDLVIENVDYNNDDDCKKQPSFKQTAYVTVVQGARAAQVKLTVCGYLPSSSFTMKIPSLSSSSIYDLDVNIPNHCESRGGVWCPGRLECHDRACK